MSRALRIVAVAILAGIVTTQADAQGSPPPAPGGGSTYIALGDSLAYGVTAPGVPTDPQCQSATAPSYVCIVHGYLRQANSGLQLQNLGVPDMDSCVLVHGYGNGSPCVNAPATGDVGSPLQSAIAMISAHPDQIGLVTLNVGGADLIPLLPGALADPAGTAAKLPALFRAYQANLDTALAQLRSALGTNGKLLLITQYNPLGGIPSPPLPAGLPGIASGAINAMNQVMKAEAAKYNVTVADVAAAFDAAPGGAATLTFVPSSLASGDPSKIDIYPTLDGYRLFGQTVLKAASAAAPFVLKLRAGHKTLKHGKTETVTVGTVSGAGLTYSLSLPHAHPPLAAPAPSADNNGAASVAFPSGKRKGKGTLKVCAIDPVTGHSGCAKARFTVT